MAKVKIQLPYSVTVRKNWRVTPITGLWQWCDNNVGHISWDFQWNNDGELFQHPRRLSFYSSATFYFRERAAAVQFELTHG